MLYIPESLAFTSSSKNGLPTTIGEPGLSDGTPVPAGAKVQALSKIKPINNEAVKRIKCKIRIDEWVGSRLNSRNLIS
jgi:hypothetical protein